MKAHVTAEFRLRDRNQMTMPDAVVQAGGLLAGDRFVVEIDPADPDIIRLHRIRPSYAGALRGLYGDPGEYLETERASWD